MRLKYRYLICQIMSDFSDTPSSISLREVQSKLHEMISSLYGDIGGAQHGNFKMIYFDPISGVMAIRVVRESEEEVHFALSCMSGLSSKGHVNTSIRCLRKTGCLRTCLLKLWEILEMFVDQNYSGATGTTGAAVGSGSGSASGGETDRGDVVAIKRRYLAQLRAIDPA